LDKVFPASFSSPDEQHRDKDNKDGDKNRDKFEYMLNGSVDLEMRSGKKAAALWAARAVVLVDDGDGDRELKYEFYQVYLTL